VRELYARLRAVSTKPARTRVHYPYSAASFFGWSLEPVQRALHGDERGAAGGAAEEPEEARSPALRVAEREEAGVRRAV